MMTRVLLLLSCSWAWVACGGEPTNPDEELPGWYAIVNGSVLLENGGAPDPDAHDPYGYVINIWTEGFGCEDDWEGNSSRRLSQRDGTWVGSISFPAVATIALEDSVCTHVILLPPPASPWRADTISVGALVVRQEPPYDSAEAHFILKPKVDTAASR